MEDMKTIEEQMRSCVLCPRECGVNRLEGRRGVCGCTADLVVARAALHQWEELCISGSRGSGTIFFSGCSLRRRFCQNQEISQENKGNIMTKEYLTELFFRLQQQGAHNINLVTGCHYIPQIAWSIRQARQRGFSLPVVYNSSGYEKVESLRQLEGLVDIWLPDFKYMDPALAADYSSAADYPQYARAAIEEMVRQCPEPSFDPDGMIRKGVIVRQLLLPGHVKDAMAVTKWLHETFGSRIYISLMSQYTPMEAVRTDPLLGRRVTRREYEKLVDYALSLGVVQGFTQDREVAKESFIPDFNEGV